MDVQFCWGTHEDGYWRKGPWTAQEDKLLIEHVNIHGEGRWNSVSKLTGLRRSGKSCRLRWVNYLRPDLKRGKMTPEEENTIHELHALWGNRWSTIARSLPGRTDNEIKNYWRTHFKKSKPSKKVERARATFLMQQKQQQKQKEKADQDEQQQPQLLQQQQQQQEELEEEKAAMSMSMHIDEMTRLAQDMEEDMATSFMLYPLSHYWLHGGSCDASVSDGSTDQEDESSWGSLWNLDGGDGGVVDLLAQH